MGWADEPGRHIGRGGGQHRGNKGQERGRGRKEKAILLALLASSSELPSPFPSFSEEDSFRRCRDSVRRKKSSE